MTTKLLPIALDLTGRACLVVGAGAELEARARSLAELGGVVSVVSERPSEPLLALARDRGLGVAERAFRESDLDGVWLVVIASDDAAEVEAVSRAAEARRVHYCAVDRPTRGSFSHMALARAGSLVLAVSTAGEAPALSRRLRRRARALAGRIENRTLRRPACRASTAYAAWPPPRRARACGRRSAHHRTSRAARARRRRWRLSRRISTARVTRKAAYPAARARRRAPGMSREWRSNSNDTGAASNPTPESASAFFTHWVARRACGPRQLPLAPGNTCKRRWVKSTVITKLIAALLPRLRRTVHVFADRFGQRLARSRAAVAQALAPDPALQPLRCT